jgi:hypothetical protein
MLDPEKENFVVHPERRGSQRTDADLLAVRFPHRAERLFDDPNDIMADDEQGLRLSHDWTNQPCTLDGPWTQPDHQNVPRVLAAIGCLPPYQIKQAAADIYRAGVHVSEFGLRIRLVAVGREPSEQLSATFPDVAQLTWAEMLAFIWERLRRYRQQKTQVDQWDAQGRRIKRLADLSAQAEPFIGQALHLMGVRREPTSIDFVRLCALSTM